MPFIERLSFVYAQQDAHVVSLCGPQQAERSFAEINDAELAGFLRELDARFNPDKHGEMPLDRALDFIGKVRSVSQGHRDLLKKHVVSDKIIPAQSRRTESRRIVHAISPDGFFTLATLQELLYRQSAQDGAYRRDLKIDWWALYTQARELLGESSISISENLKSKAKAAEEKKRDLKGRYWSERKPITQKVNEVRQLLGRSGGNGDLQKLLGKIPIISTDSLTEADVYGRKELQDAFSHVPTLGISDTVNRGLVQQKYPPELITMLLFCRAVANRTLASFDPKVPSLTKTQLLEARDIAAQRIRELQEKGSDITSISRLYYHDANRLCTAVEIKAQISQTEK